MFHNRRKIVAVCDERGRTEEAFFYTSPDWSMVQENFWEKPQDEGWPKVDDEVICSDREEVEANVTG